jgi:hypothetical protein
LFEATKISGEASSFVCQIWIEEKKFVYIKNEGANLGTMVATLNVIVSCENLGLEEPFQGTCFGHNMLKACQYDTTNNKVFMGSHEIFI